MKDMAGAGSSDKVLLENNDVFIYKIPTDVKRRKKRSAHRAKDWDLANPDGTYKLTLVAAGNVCHIQLKDENGGLFGQAVIDACPGTGLTSEPEVTSSTSICIVADSTRYFTLKLQNRSGEYELVGLGFGNRDDSSTLTKALEKYFGSELRKSESSLNKDKKTAAPISKIKPIPRAQSQKPTPIPPQDRKNNDVRLEEKGPSKPISKSIPDAKSKQANSRPENNSKSGKNTKSQSNSISQPKPILIPFYCNLSGCTKGFYSEEALLEHRMAKHGQSKNLTKQGPKKPLLPVPPPLLPIPPPQSLLSMNIQPNQYARGLNMPNPTPLHSSSRKMAGPAPIPLRPTSIQIRRSPPAPAPSYPRQGQWQGQNQRGGAPHGSWSRPQERERAMENRSRPSNQLSFSDFLAMKEQEDKSKNMEHTFSEQFRIGGAGVGSAMEIDAASAGPPRAGQQQLHGGPGERNSPSQYKGQHQNQQERLEARNVGRNEYHQGQPPKNPNDSYPLPTETQRFLQSLEKELFERENQHQLANQDQRIVYLNEDQHQLLHQDQSLVFRNQQLQSHDQQMALFNPDQQMMFLNQDQQMMFLNQDQPMMFLNQDQQLMLLNQDQPMMFLHEDQQLFHNQDQRFRGNHGRNQLPYDDHPQYYGGHPENQNRLVARTSLNPRPNLVRSGAPVPLLPVMGRNTKQQKSRPIAPEKGKQQEKQQEKALAETRQKPFEGGLAYRASHNKFRCHWCPTTYFSTESEKALQTHWKQGHGLTNPIVCKMCTLVFFTAVELKKHKQDHHVFNCTVCSQECVTEKSLRSHLKRIHDQNLQYACHVCSASFNSKDTFTTHLGECRGKRAEGRKSRKMVNFPPEVVVVGEGGGGDVGIATTQMEVIQVSDEDNGAKPMETSQVEETERKNDDDDDDDIQIIGIFESDGIENKK